MKEAERPAAPDDTDRREAREIIATLVQASAAARQGRRPPRWYDRIIGTDTRPVEALLIMTAVGQVGAYMTETGHCVLRCRGDANVNRHLRAVLPEQRVWHEGERAWSVAGPRIEEALAAIVSARRQSEQAVPNGHAESHDEVHHRDHDSGGAAPVTPVVMNSRYGMMTGQQQGDVVEIMVLDPRMQDDLRRHAGIGTYRQDRLIGLWAVEAHEFARATEWAASEAA